MTNKRRTQTQVNGFVIGDQVKLAVDSNLKRVDTIIGFIEDTTTPNTWNAQFNVRNPHLGNHEISVNNLERVTWRIPELIPYGEEVIIQTKDDEFFTVVKERKGENGFVLILDSHRTTIDICEVKMWTVMPARFIEEKRGY